MGEENDDPKMFSVVICEVEKNCDQLVVRHLFAADPCCIHAVSLRRLGARGGWR